MNIDKNTITLLRIPFSFFLLPVFCFALSQSDNIHIANTLLIFIALHLFIYPASNGYNSYMDKDEGSIGGLRNPPKPTDSLFTLTFLLDISGLILTSFISIQITLLVLLYILASRAYSNKKIRLKKYPITGFLVVSIFQGAVIYLVSFASINDLNLLTAFTPETKLNMLASSLLIGATYPLTQIYQHKSDLKDGVKTLSYVLGYKGTFVFSAVLFLLASIILFYSYSLNSKLVEFVIFQLFMLPVLSFFFNWFFRVYRNTSAANFDNTMRMNSIASLCLVACFITLTILK